VTDRVGVQMLHHYEPRLPSADQWPEGRKPLAPRPTLRFLLLWRVAASPRRQKLIPTRYLPHRLLVKRVPHLVRNGTRMCSRLQQVAVFPMGPPCILTCSPRSAAPSGQGLSHCGPPRHTISVIEQAGFTECQLLSSLFMTIPTLRSLP
jgi:hypothetical protein